MIASRISAVRARAQAFAGNALARRVAGSSFWSLLIKLASAALTYIMLAMLARAMDPLRFGRFGIAFSLASFLAVLASMGLHTGILRWVPEYEAKAAPVTGRQALRWSLIVTLAAGAGISIAMMASVWLLPLQSERVYLYAGALLIIPLVLAEFIGSALRGFGSVILAQLPRDVLWRLAVMGFTGVGLVLWGGLTESTALVLAAVSLLAVMIPQFVRLAPALAADPGRRWPPRAERVGWARQLLPYWGTALIYAMTQYVDVVLVGSFVSPQAAGAYFAAARTASLAALMLIASNMVSAPLIASAFHAQDRAQLAQLLKIIALCISIPTLGVVALLAGAGPMLLAFFDPLYVSAYPILLVLVAGHAINGLSGPMGYVLQLTGHGDANLRIMLLSYATGIVIQIALLITLGAIGAAIGSTAAIILWNGLCRSVAKKRVGVDPTILNLLKRAK